jgi:hypothetical protein
MSFSIAEIWTHSPVFAKGIWAILAIMSLWSMSVALQKWWNLRSAQKETIKFAPEFSQFLTEDNLSEAINLAQSYKKSHVARVLGRAGDLSVEIDRILTDGNIPRPFSPETLAQASTFPAAPSEPDKVGREDLRDIALCTIDGDHHLEPLPREVHDGGLRQPTHRVAAEIGGEQAHRVPWRAAHLDQIPAGYPHKDAAEEARPFPQDSDS